MFESGFVSDPGAGLAELIATVRAEAVALGRDDLGAQLPGPIGAGHAGRLRVVVAGVPGAGKSSLINSLLGRPGLSPAATGCWIEFRYTTAAVVRSQTRIDPAKPQVRAARMPGAAGVCRPAPSAPALPRPAPPTFKEAGASKAH